MKRLSVVILFFLAVQKITAQTENPLLFSFDKKYGQVEVGGPFAGAEFHNSRPLPSRISLYYPVANSIDVSKEYWKRDESRPMAIGVKIGDGKKKWIGREAWKYVLSPHTVTFSNKDSMFSYQVKYEFCSREPAMVVSFVLKNETKQPQRITTYSHLLLALRTCQTYTRKDSAQMMYTSDGQTIVAQFTDTDTKSASVYVMNAGEKAVQSWCDANDLSVTDDGESSWMDSSFTFNARNILNQKWTRAVAAFEYSKELQSDETMKMVLVIGSAKGNEVKEKIANLSKNWMNEIQSYDKYVKAKSLTETHFVTGNYQLDRSLQWAKAILATNAHYLDGQIVPMPCPAEYNFFFTHDLLMTNLGAVNYDLNRVKKNLLYIVSLAKDSIIPHAYYWRDDGFKTEYCTPSNWNHLWFIEVSASYLRHSLDTVTIRHLYPLITKSLTEVMTQLRDDHLMHAFRPDWWDIGWKEGQRTYITALGIREIENYLFIASMIDRDNSSLKNLERRADAMRSALVGKLWDDSLNYLINYNGKDKDEHKYMGSLLAPAFHLLEKKRSEKMIESVKNDLLAPGVGIRAVMPMDFHKDSVIKYFNIAGNEAGNEYTYINGGVWPHNNAWYALALHSVGKFAEAINFVKQTMTIDGVAQSPNGIPAMYEYRYSNQSSPRYGEIDKPSFLWAGGFYLYTMYTLVGMNDNVWNLSVSENRARFDSTVHFSYTFATTKDVEITGNGNMLTSFSAEGKMVSSLVLPLEIQASRSLSVQFGEFSTPYLIDATAIVHSVQYATAKRYLECKVSSFQGHSTTVRILSKKKPYQILLNGKIKKNFATADTSDASALSTITFDAGKSIDIIQVQW